MNPLINKAKNIVIPFSDNSNDIKSTMRSFYLTNQNYLIKT